MVDDDDDDDDLQFTSDNPRKKKKKHIHQQGDCYLRSTVHFPDWMFVLPRQTYTPKSGCGDVIYISHQNLRA